MRFLNTSTLQFVHVPHSELHLDSNQYAILSYRWGADEDEVSFEDIQLSTDISGKKGFAKLKGFCKLALSEGCRYGWVDTCCINKGNSSELGEAINSMYQWYQASKICIAYLEDVPQRQLISSSWFDRGWTLQELIGPKTVVFCNHDWHIIGTKIELIAELSSKTKIPDSVLSHATKPSACSVAQRMSWAANRITTRVEDRAYSLMGLFDVYMPMIYGEREKAFLRLQQHIIQKSKDESIFACSTEFPGNSRTYSGLFAPSPLAYVYCSEIIQTQGSGGFSEVNGELSITSMIAPYSMETYSALLHCTHRANPDDNVSILVTTTSNEGQYVRVRDVGDAGQTLISSSHRARFIKQQIHVLVDPTEPPVNTFNGFWLRTLQPPGYAQCQTVVLSNSLAPGTDYIYQHDYSQGITGLVHMRPSTTTECSEWSHVHWIKFGFDTKFNPVLWLASAKHSQRLQLDFEAATALGPESYLHQKIMSFAQDNAEENWPSNEPNTEGGWPNEYEKWTNGAFVIAIDKKKGFCSQVVSALNLRISVQLQLRHKRTVDAAKTTDDGGLPLSPMKIWVVDINDIGGVTPEKRARRRKKGAEREALQRTKDDQQRERVDLRVRSRLCCFLFLFHPTILGILVLVLWLEGELGPSSNEGELKLH
ncbi:hypothetical protein MMC28_005527 [Mycoblastus sanguinarius]|nr:hypothetical protein [Mycoblastus sanguinarius]